MPEQGSEVTYNTMVKVASYAGDVDRAMAVLEDMAAAGFAPTTAVWGSLQIACGKVCTSRQACMHHLSGACASALAHCHLPHQRTLPFPVGPRSAETTSELT